MRYLFQVAEWTKHEGRRAVTVFAEEGSLKDEIVQIQLTAKEGLSDCVHSVEDCGEVRGTFLCCQPNQKASLSWVGYLNSFRRASAAALHSRTMRKHWRRYSGKNDVPPRI